ncbi:hypothetical protein MLD38_015399 [Melastoma candidum]|uniref:Uncharacterized protein n=1 Tax=Melastoma candidum TaxID=119954 RepID=A0ACB9RJ30_9MYRT|nr:hypothetical protein MLD38_015399 [Melastoma candidum]
MDPYVLPNPDGCITPTSNSSGDREHHPKYRGVRKRKWGKWVAEIRLPNCRERIWLGSYDTPEKAARAFDAALYCLRGRDAQFNLPDSPPDITVPSCLSPREIREVAEKFANEHEHREGLITTQHDVVEGQTLYEGGEGSSECGNMGWPFQDKWFYDDRIYGGMGYVGNQVQPSDHQVNAFAEGNKQGGGDADVEYGNLHDPYGLWNFLS